MRIVVRVVGQYLGSVTCRTRTSALREAKALARRNPGHWVDAKDLDTGEIIVRYAPKKGDVQAAPHPDQLEMIR